MKEGYTRILMEGNIKNHGEKEQKSERRWKNKFKPIMAVTFVQPDLVAVCLYKYLFVDIIHLK